METRTVDVAIIGAGTAGLSARREVDRRGRDWMLIERGPHGTTCARVGCMPSKLLIAAADAAHEVQRAGEFGVKVPQGVRVDGRAVMERVRRERDRFTGFVLEAIDDIDPRRLVEGQARFVGPRTLMVDDRVRVEAKAVIIATGSAPWIPPSLDAVRDRVLVNDDVFEMRDLPESIAVFGTGIIGLELGQALSRLGVRVGLFNPFSVIGPLTDPEVHNRAVEDFGAELQLHLGIRDEVVEPHPEGGVVVRWTDPAGEHEARYDHVLSAAGRRPNLAGLDLELANVQLDERGAPVFDRHTMQVADQPVFIAGDVANHRPVLHEAADEGRIAGANAAMWPEVVGHVRRTPLAITFTDPQIALVGASFRELEGKDVEVGEVSYEDQGRARVAGRNRGLVRIYAERRGGCLLGAELLGPSVEHMAHLLAWAIDMRIDVQRALTMPYYHPVVEEGLRTALRDLGARLKLAPQPCAFELNCGPGT